MEELKLYKRTISDTNITGELHPNVVSNIKLIQERMGDVVAVQQTKRTDGVCDDVIIYKSIIKLLLSDEELDDYYILNSAKASKEEFEEYIENNYPTDSIVYKVKEHMYDSYMEREQQIIDVQHFTNWFIRKRLM